MKYALNQPSWRRLWGRCELGECLVSESEADGDSARSSVAAVEEGAQRRPLQAVADGDSARGSVAAVEEGAQRRPLPAVAPTEATQASVLQSSAASAPLVDCDVSTASCSAPGGAMMLLAPALSAAAPLVFQSTAASAPLVDCDVSNAPGGARMVLARYYGRSPRLDLVGDIAGEAHA